MSRPIAVQNQSKERKYREKFKVSLAFIRTAWSQVQINTDCRGKVIGYVHANLRGSIRGFKAAARLAQFGERRLAQRVDVALNPNRKNDQGLLRARSNGRHAIVVALQKNFESK